MQFKCTYFINRLLTPEATYVYREEGRGGGGGAGERRRRGEGGWGEGGREGLQFNLLYPLIIDITSPLDHGISMGNN